MDTNESNKDKGFVNGNARIKELSEKPGIAERIAKIEAQAKIVETVFDVTAANQSLHGESAAASGRKLIMETTGLTSAELDFFFEEHTRTNSTPEQIVDSLEDVEIAKIVRERSNGKDTPLWEIAKKLGLDPNDYK